jgi:hypothetical protein
VFPLELVSFHEFALMCTSPDANLLNVRLEATERVAFEALRET